MGDRAPAGGLRSAPGYDASTRVGFTFFGPDQHARACAGFIPETSASGAVRRCEVRVEERVRTVDRGVVGEGRESGVEEGHSLARSQEAKR